MPEYVQLINGKGETEFWERPTEDAAEMLRVATVRASMSESFINFLVSERGMVRPAQQLALSPAPKQKSSTTKSTPKKKTAAKRKEPVGPVTVTDTWWADQVVDDFLPKVLTNGEAVTMAELRERLSVHTGHNIANAACRLRVEGSPLIERIPVPHPLPDGVPASTAWLYQLVP